MPPEYKLPKYKPLKICFKMSRAYIRDFTVFEINFWICQEIGQMNQHLVTKSFSRAKMIEKLIYKVEFLCNLASLSVPSSVTVINQVTLLSIFLLSRFYKGEILFWVFVEVLWIFITNCLKKFSNFCIFAEIIITTLLTKTACTKHFAFLVFTCVQTPETFFNILLFSMIRHHWKL